MPSRQPKQTVRCGMTIIEADPVVDKKMLVAPKDDPNYVIRVVPPPVCGAPR